MPLPLGHAAIGLLSLNLVSKEKPFRAWLFLFLIIVALANLPDIDVVFGLIAVDNGGFFHRGPTHSILFALIMGYIVSYFVRRLEVIPQISFFECTLIILSHVFADLLLTNTPVSLFWPLEVNFSSELKSWSDVFNSVVYKAYKDLGIVAFSVIVLLVKYSLKKAPFYTKLVRQKTW